MNTIKPKTTRPRQAHNLYLDEGVIKRAKEIAPNTRHKSVSGLVEFLLTQYVDKKNTGLSLDEVAVAAQKVDAAFACNPN